MAYFFQNKQFPCYDFTIISLKTYNPWFDIERFQHLHNIKTKGD